MKERDSPCTLSPKSHSNPNGLWPFMGQHRLLPIAVEMCRCNSWLQTSPRALTLTSHGSCMPWGRREVYTAVKSNLMLPRCAAALHALPRHGSDPRTLMGGCPVTQARHGWQRELAAMSITWFGHNCCVGRETLFSQSPPSSCSDGVEEQLHGHEVIPGEHKC